MSPGWRVGLLFSIQKKRPGGLFPDHQTQTQGEEARYASGTAPSGVREGHFATTVMMMTEGYTNSHNPRHRVVRMGL